MKLGEIIELPLSASNQRCYKRLWSVQGRGANPYTVSIKSGGTDVGTWGCSCPDWTKHMPRQDCKHILQVKWDQIKFGVKVKLIPIATIKVGRLFRDIPVKQVEVL
jgi:hypothetical protein